MIFFILAVLICLYGIQASFKLVFILANSGNSQGTVGTMITAFLFSYLLGYILYTNTLIIWK